MGKFKGFELIKILRAATSTSPGIETDETHLYECEIHSMHGVHKDKTLIPLATFKSLYGTDLGMTKSKYGKLQGGEVQTLTEAQYNTAVNEWNNS